MIVSGTLSSNGKLRISKSPREPDLFPSFRTQVNMMISDKGKRKRYVAEQTHGPPERLISPQERLSATKLGTVYQRKHSKDAEVLRLSR